MAYDGVAPSGVRVDRLLAIAQVLENLTPEEPFVQWRWGSCAIGWAARKIPETIDLRIVEHIADEITFERISTGEMNGKPCSIVQLVSGCLGLDYREALVIFGEPDEDITPLGMARKLRDRAQAEMTVIA